MDLQDLNTRQLPLSVRYSQITPLGVVASSKKRKFLPSNAGTFTQNNNTIRIPISSSTSFLDPQLTMLKFDFTNKSGANATFDNSAHSVIGRLRLISRSGGVDLEDIREYAHLHAILSDVQYSPIKRFQLKYSEGYGNAGAGFSGAITAQAAGNVVAAQNAFSASAETSIKFGTNEITLANDTSHTFCIPLLSSLIGQGQQKYIPLFLTGQLDLELELYPNCLFGSSAPAFNVNNVELHCQLIDFAGDMNMRLQQMAMQSGIYLHATSWSAYNYALADGVSTVQIAERLKSVKTLLLAFSINRNNTYTNRALGRVSRKLKSLQVKIGSEYYPTQPIVGQADSESKNSEFIHELYKSLSEYGNVLNTGIIDGVNFARNTASDDDEVGRAVYGLDLDAFHKAPLESGVNMILNNPMLIEWTADGGFIGCDTRIFLLHDTIFALKPDGTFTVSK